MYCNSTLKPATQNIRTILSASNKMIVHFLLIAHFGVRNTIFLLVIIFSRTCIGEPRQCNDQNLQVDHSASPRVEL